MKLPPVAANVSLSLDGKIVARTKEPTALASMRDRRRLLELRAETDAILIGRGTLEADDMAMRLPSAGLRAKHARGGTKPEPLRVIFSNSGRIRKNLRLFRDSGAPIVVFTTKAMPASTKLWLEEVADVHVEPRSMKVGVRRALAVLARDYGVRSALCEGRAQLLCSLLEARTVSVLHITFAPVVLGGADAPTLLGPARSSLLEKSIPLRLEKFCRQRSEAFATYRVATGSKPRQ